VTPVGKAKRTLIGIEIPRDELAMRIAQQCLSMSPPSQMPAAEALDQLAQQNARMVDGFRRAADAAVLYFHECINAGRQPS
jgi:HAMP domain-containing protein